MVYKDKARDMRRSPLPSTHRKGARDDKRRARKTSRRVARQLCDTTLEYGWDDAVEQYDPTWDNMEPAWGGHGTRGVVRERRAADNIAALMRWAQALAKNNPDSAPDELRAMARSVLGHGYMADHAMSHIENLEEFEENPYRYGLRSYRTDYLERNRIRKEQEFEQMVSIVQDAWLRGRNKDLKAFAHKHCSKTSKEPIDEYGWRHKTKTEYPRIRKNKRWLWDLDNPKTTYVNWRIPMAYDDIEECVTTWQRSAAYYTDLIEKLKAAIP